MARRTRFFGWKVVTAAFITATFSWGVSFYGPPVFLYVIHETRGWSVTLISAAITCHYLTGAVFVMNLPRFHARFGLMPVTVAGALLTATGFVGWAAATEPWQLFAATVPTGLGWAATGGAAINAMVVPWFVARRPVALSMAYNGASVGGIVFSALWVVLIAALGFGGATVLVGLAMSVIVSFLALRYLAATPAGIGLTPDCEHGANATKRPAHHGNPRLPGGALYANPQFATLAAGMALGLFAQIGLLAHLYSLLVPALGETGAGIAMSYATVCAIAGRMTLASLMDPSVDRRSASALAYGLQILGCLAFVFAAGNNIALLLVGITLFGSGIGNATSLPPLIAQVEFTEVDAARTVALIIGTSQAAFAFAPAAFGLLREPASVPGANAAATPSLFISAACVQVLAAGAMLLGRRKHRAQ